MKLPVLLDQSRDHRLQLRQGLLGRLTSYSPCPNRRGSPCVRLPPSFPTSPPLGPSSLLNPCHLHPLTACLFVDDKASRPRLIRLRGWLNWRAYSRRWLSVSRQRDPFPRRLRQGGGC